MRKKTMKEFRQLTVADTAEYHKVLIDGYAAIKDYPITFDAIDFKMCIRDSLYS